MCQKKVSRDKGEGRCNSYPWVLALTPYVGVFAVHALSDGGVLVAVSDLGAYFHVEGGGLVDCPLEDQMGLVGLEQTLHLYRKRRQGKVHFTG